MVRQFLYGQRFTEKYLGYRSDSFWLPDTFGYNAAIPQIMQKSGVKYLLLPQKWVGTISTTSLPTHSSGAESTAPKSSPTSTARTSSQTSEHLTGIIRDNTDKSSCDMRLAAYGFGDGGGGPTPAMLEFLKRAKDLDGMPKG